MLKKNSIAQRLKSLDKGIKFLNKFGRRHYSKSKEKMELDQVVNQINNRSLNNKSKNYFFQNYLNKLIFIYSFGFIFCFLILAITLPILTLDFNSEFFDIYRTDISLTIAFILLGILSFCFGNLLLNISRRNLIKKIIFRNKKLILKNVFANWELDEMKLLESKGPFDLIQINHITLYIPRQRKERRVILISALKTKSILKISKKNIQASFDEAYKNNQFSELLKSEKIFRLFQSFEIDFNTNEKSVLKLRSNINIDQLLALIFIVFIFSIYTEKIKGDD